MILSAVTIEWIGYASKRCTKKNADSYERIVQEQLGSTASVIITFCLLINVFGAMVGFIIIIGDMVQPIAQLAFGNNIFTDRGFVTLVFLLLVILPISSLQNIDSLKFTSILSLISITFVVLMVTGTTFYKIIENELPQPKNINAINFSWEIFQAIPVITFALTCHAQAPPIFAELKNNTVNRFRIVIGITYTICFFLYILNGSMGYIQFQGNTMDNILNNYPQDDWLANLARLAVTFTVTFSYPLMNYAYRTSFDYLMFTVGFKIFCRKVDVSTLPDELNITIPSVRRYILETVVAGIICWILNVLVPQISVIFGLMGAIGGSSIVFIFPAILQFKVS